MTMIDGRKATVVRAGNTFTTYRLFADKHGYPDAAAEDDGPMYDKRSGINNGDTVKLLVSGPHMHGYNGKTLWIVETAAGDRYIIGEEGLDIEKITVLADDFGLQREYREVERKARVGERIIIVNACAAGSAYRNGSILKVRSEVGINSCGTAVLAEGVDIGIFDSEYVVLEPTDIVRIDDRRYRLIERKANVGERVVVTNVRYDCFHVGEVLTIVDIADYHGYDAYSVRKTFVLRREDSLVLEPIGSEFESPTPAADDTFPSDNERIAQLERQFKRMTDTLAEVGRKLSRMETDLRVAREDIVLIEEGVRDDIDRLERKVGVGKYVDPETVAIGKRQLTELTREAVIERAKADVASLLDENYPVIKGYNPSVWFTNKDGSIVTDKCTFIENRYKRTVVALITTLEGDFCYRGRATCAPNEVFNVHIGKAIALRRALGLTVPDEYVNAPQPEEAQVGDVVTGSSPSESHAYSQSKTFTLSKRYGDDSFRYAESPTDWIYRRQIGRILDDSRDGYVAEDVAA